MLRLLLLLIVFLSVQSFAYTPKEGNVSVITGPFVSQTKFEPSGQQSPAPYLGGAVLMVQGDISDHGALEIAMIKMNKVFYREENGDFLSEQTELMHIALGYRKWFTPYFSGALDFFSSYTMGELNVLDRRVAAGHELETSASDVTEYGFDISVQGELWSSGRYAVIADARYSYNLTKKHDEKADHYGVLIGLKYFIQEKQVKEKPKDAI